MFIYEMFFRLLAYLRLSLLSYCPGVVELLYGERFTFVQFIPFNA